MSEHALNGTAIELDDVFKVYKEGAIETVALRGISLRIASGEYVALCGPSGCGKTTLLNLVAGLASPTAGRIRVAGADVGALPESQKASLRSSSIGLVFQSDNLFQQLTVLENVRLPLRLKRQPEDRSAALSALQSVGIEGLANRYPRQISGGERQRVAIAAAIVTGAPILLADEVTGELDTKTGQVVLQILARLNHERGLTIVSVTHNPNAATSAHRIVEMRDGAIAEPAAAR